MPDRSPSRRWVILAVGLAGLTAGCAAQYGLAYLIPALRDEGRSLEQATLLVSAPIAGILLTLIAWGAAADRWGERRILVAGLGGAGVAELGVAGAEAEIARLALLVVTGASSAAIHAASGRLILGWFGVGERGLAMGIRQMGQPLGVGAAAITLPPVAARWGVDAAFVALGGACLVTAAVIGVVVRNPARPQLPAGSRRSSPYGGGYLWRIHAASGLLVIPQFAVAVFAFDYLVTGLGWSSALAGPLLAIAQVLGAGSRLAVGWWSDRVGSRLGPMRLIAVGIGLSMGVLGLLASAGEVAVAALAIAAVVTVTPNGLAFTAVAERAGPRWAGRALGVQNTFQNVIAAAVAAPLAVVIGLAGGGPLGYGVAFALAGVAPVIAAAVIPVRRERPLGATWGG